MEKVPAYVSVVFMITTFVAVGIFLSAVRKTTALSSFGKIVLFLVPFWLFFQFVLASGGFFQDTSTFPPRLFIFGLGPALLVIFLSLVAAGRRFFDSLPLAVLTIVHVVRIPVELTLSWLSDAGVVPGIITFHGTNFDIFSGLTAPIAFYFAVKNSAASRSVLIFWNVAALALLLNVLITAILCIPSPTQKLAFDQPNVAVLYSPYIWLPTVVVPIVLFAHLASLYKLLILKRPIRPEVGLAQSRG